MNIFMSIDYVSILESLIPYLVFINLSMENVLILVNINDPMM